MNHLKLESVQYTSSSHLSLDNYSSARGKDVGGVACKRATNVLLLMRIARGWRHQ